jgi:hypothetical protein
MGVAPFGALLTQKFFIDLFDRRLFFLRNVLQGAAVLRRVPMDHLCYQNKGAALEQESIEGESALLSCLITPKGMPAIITSALHAYLYDNELGKYYDRRFLSLPLLNCYGRCLDIGSSRGRSYNIII